MSKPDRVYTIDVYCICRQYLFRYRKEGGGHLVKCFKSNIDKNETKEEWVCPSCKKPFAKDRVVKNRPVLQVIKGRVFVRGHHG